MRAKCTFMTSRVRCSTEETLLAATMGAWGRKSTKTCLFMKVHFSARKLKNGGIANYKLWGLGLGWAGRSIDDGSFTHQAIRVEWCTASAYAWCTSAFVDGYSKSVVAGKILKKHCTKLHFYMINGCYLVKQTRHLDG